MKNSTPPKFFLNFFRWFCHPKLLKYIEGDLMELYEERKGKSGKWKADALFVKDVLLLFRPSIIKPADGYQKLNTYGMYKSYFKIGWRNLIKNKGFTAINTAGLTLGITCAIILFLIVDHGRSFDKYHSKRDRIYRVVSKSKSNEGFSFTQGIPSALPTAFKDDFPSVNEVVFTSFRRGNLITVFNKENVKKYEEEKGVVFTEPSFFKIFDRKLLIGNVDKALAAPNEALISQNWATKYFGDENAVGEMIEYQHVSYKIVGVLEDYPTNTDLPFDLMLSYATIKGDYATRGWGSVSDSDNCYFLLNENSSIAGIEDQVSSFVNKYVSKNANGETESTFIMQPLAELHTDMRFGNYNRKLPMAAQIAFIVIAIFLLTSACINFINLSTAEAVKRTREVGIRKVLGSTRKQLINQFIIEAFLVTLASVSFSLVAVELLLKIINPYMGLSLVLYFTQNTWIFLFMLIVLITMSSGFYPAWMVSGFKPILALKNMMDSKGSSGFTLRKGLVVFQFFISQLFVIGTIVITQQMDFMQTQNMGFAKDAIITVPIPTEENKEANPQLKKRVLKNEILRLGGTEGASLSYSPPSYSAVLGTSFTLADSTDEFTTQLKQVDGDYINLYKVELIAGEGLLDSDSMTSVVVNEKLVQVAGFKNVESIVGREISLWGKQLLVRGVVRDFNTQSLSHAIEPVILVNDINAYQHLSAKLNPLKMQETIEDIKAEWESLYPEYIFKYSFVDDQVRNLYNGERKTSTLISVFAFIAICIGCLGLLGLVMFMNNQKTKEVGIRKVLGASATSIVFLFTKEFGKLILLGFLLAAPISWFLMNKVLEEFAYKIDIGPSIFILCLFMTFLISFITVGYLTLRAALVNPVDSLRAE
jgi:putative ABC transport system permease protein